jgi:hypothetical protein
MSFSDWVASNTVGILFRARTGNVDPWTLNLQKEELAANIAQAKGPNADPADVAAAQVAAANEVDGYLKSIGEHPDQACGGVTLPVIGCLDGNNYLDYLNKLVLGALAIGALVGGFWLYQSYGSTVKQVFKKR